MQELRLALQHQLAYRANIEQLVVTNLAVGKKCFRLNVQSQTVQMFFSSTKSFLACYQMNKGHKSTSFREISTQDNLLTADKH